MMRDTLAAQTPAPTSTPAPKKAAPAEAWVKRRSLTGLGPGPRALVTLACLFWAFFTLFPLYWVLITAFKSPPGVVAGPTYLPFVDFEPSLRAWTDILAGIRGEFYYTTLNSTIVGLSAAAIATTLGAMAAYALVRFTFRVKLASGLAFFVVALGGYLIGHEVLGYGRAQALMLSFVLALASAILVDRLPVPGPILGNPDIVFWFVSQRMFPPIVTAFALYLMYTEMGRMGFRMVDTFLGLTLCYVAFSLPIVVWLMRDFFQALPIEVEEAAMVDNVPHWRIFFGIVVPMSAPGLAATFMITLAFIWNEFLFALFSPPPGGRPCPSSSPARTASAATNGGRSRRPP
jgi:multiple sugar transport system permease protein